MIGTLFLIHTNEIDDLMDSVQPSESALRDGVRLSDDDNFAVRQHVFDVVDEKRRQMGQMRTNEVKVCARERRILHVGIVDPQVVTLAVEPFGKLHQRALT